MKLIFALHAEGLATTLLDPALRDALRAAGATRLQVNVDDDAVAPAMRFGPGDRVTAVISLWTDADPGPVVDVVRRLDGSADGWQVTERVPLAGPEVPDGERADALANVALLRRPDAMSHEDWTADWLERHTQVAIDTQGTFGYVQNPVVAALTPDPPAVAGIVEELFAMAAMTDHHAFYGSGGDEAEFQRRFATLMESCARFGAGDGLDLVPTSRYRFDL
ncbi:EthD domain-containing protein [Nocardioides sambongensis]|uniref:EthD domain-containing protein n=1 Tax=Nocardioides sambongensis TaxID=2589074 RepID=UPI00112AD2A4|nr:EthD domain-containing protein [Nocardioides sambongensis]